MSSRQSCDRCRQQKVRCYRSEHATSRSGSLAQCERCAKAGANCVYSLKSTAGRRRSKHHSIHSSTQLSSKTGSKQVESASWFDQSLNEALYVNQVSLETGAPDSANQFAGLDETGSASGFNCWDANLQPFSPAPLDPLMVMPAPDATILPTTPPTTDGCDDSDEIDGCPTDSLFSQLASLSQRAMKATRRIIRSNRDPLTVSSPEVNEALELVNTLIRVAGSITAADQVGGAHDATTTSHGLAFLALACHQHLMALFRAICDAIQRFVHSRRDQIQQQKKQDYNGSRQDGELGPSVVAQFVMVLQLVMHLINRMDRSLFQSTPPTPRYPDLFSDEYSSPMTNDILSPRTIDPKQIEEPAQAPFVGGGLVSLVSNLDETLPKEHERLRQVIQRLQTEIDFSSF